MNVRLPRLILILIALACSDDSQLPSLTYERIDFSKVEKVLILGNSITIKEPSAELGWSGNWGMAASSKEKGYVHLLAAEFRKINSDVIVDFYSAGAFEKDFWNFDFDQ